MPRRNCFHRKNSMKFFPKIFATFFAAAFVLQNVFALKNTLPANKALGFVPQKLPQK
jgi:hypothetical protein